MSIVSLFLQASIAADPVSPDVAPTIVTRSPLLRRTSSKSTLVIEERNL